MTADTLRTPLPHANPVPKGRIGRFVFESEIGQGSVGIVYLFRDPLIGRKVAIKILNPQLPSNQRQLFEKHFIQEARAAGRLNHPNIVTVYDADKEGDLLYIVMEYLEGKELRDLMTGGHQFSYKQIADMIARTANALDYAHEHGVIHRDIKPANIFITGSATPKVLDFGIASASRQLSDGDATLGHDHLSEQRLLGTPNYMSPEQTRGESVDARTDIFSLGVVLYQLLCGELPFKGDSIKQILHAIAHDPAIPPQEIRTDVPLRLARIAAKALAKKPADRYARASDMANDLNRFLSKERADRIIAKIQQPGAEKELAAANSTGDRRRKNEQKKLGINHALIAVGLTIAIAVGAWSWMRPAPQIVATGVTPVETSTTPLPAPAAAENSVVAASSSVKEDSEEIINLPLTSVTAPEKKAKTDAVAAKPQQKTKTSATATAPSAPLVVGAVQIAVSPWGEVYVDGEAKGVAPPLTRLNLAVGRHKIEFRNGDDSYSVNIEVSADKENKVGHRF
ncbi:protein kinase [Undibacterium sp. Jales W-56]|uniref:serine/threonine protein kinase n=1 Tax=Undibacterium sp. Jales W-56 TaxID=2897325 RepID=UPI0021D2E087|nr:serine/threonine-protein kinase [Undibacterium sp. Jales W-56]MCU6432470.1 protein kinase [Undibacterium sp. Jales W-56]